ncbi:nucleoside recognition domain-containing protein [Sangeribacter muris]|jgi:spore maturation protein SpmA/spore maturation protein SpmB|uniref:nucleoside recognition domain-containing protein n=1 Tax=Sangeribacter muris TaxID=2880703 RepID=UPI00244DBF34|nr:nucleoside recognition domain-containing protein [Sangeribacter muris]
MVLNWIWISFFLIAFLMAAGRSLFGRDLQVWSDIMNASFDQAAFAFEISLGLTGVLTLWLGIMKIGEKAGVVEFFGRLISPFFSRLFPGIPKGHPAMGAIFMNISANMLGLDNAATPMGLKAMQEMQSLNPKKDTATDAMIMFLVLNSSGLCLIPISIMMYRAQGGAANPTDVFIPILIATAIATIVGLTALCIRQKIKMDRVIWGWLGAIAATVGAITYFFANLPADKVQLYSTFGANLILFSVIIAFILAGIRRKLRVYDVFIEGAKEGFKTAVMIIPYLVAILVAIGMFRASGALDVFTGWVQSLVAWLGFDTQWVGALPTMLMKPLSGSGSCAMMLDVMKTNGADAFVSKLAAAVRGSTDTTFYILAVYFGSVGVSKTRYAAGYALLADITGAIAAIAIAYLFF